MGFNVTGKVKNPVLVDVDHTLWLPEGTCIQWEDAGAGKLYSVADGTLILAYDVKFDNERRTTTIKICEKSLTIVQIDSVHSRQVFALNEWYAYQTWNSGKHLVLRNYCREFVSEVDFSGGVLGLKYETWSGDSLLCYRELDVYIEKYS